MTDLNDIIARLTTLTGPDRHVDGDIWWATRTPEYIEYFDETGYIEKVMKREGSAGKALALLRDDRKTPPVCLLDFAPAYTASLDAAITLYEVMPATVIPDPIRCCIDSLEQREIIRQHPNMRRFYEQSSLRARQRSAAKSAERG